MKEPKEIPVEGLPETVFLTDFRLDREIDSLGVARGRVYDVREKAIMQALPKTAEGRSFARALALIKYEFNGVVAQEIRFRAPRRKSDPAFGRVVDVVNVREVLREARRRLIGEAEDRTREALP